MTTVPPVDQYFTSGNMNLHYLDWGNEGATPLLLLHHISSNAHTWDEFSSRMREKYHVMALDMRGHGDSDWAGEGNYTTEHYADDVASLVNSRGLEGAIILGGSTGGRVGLVYVAQYPEKVAALIMEDVGAVRPASISQGFADRVAAGDPEFDTIEEWTIQLKGQNTRTPARFFESLAVHGTKRLSNGKLGLKRDVAIQRDFVPLELWNYVEKVTVPFLLLIGSESVIVGSDQQERFRAIIPDIEIVTVQDAGHIIVHDKPEEFEQIVQSFLGDKGL